MSSMQTQRHGYQSSTSMSPAAMAGVVIIHIGLGAAILNMTAIRTFVEDPKVIWVTNIPIKPKPEPVKTEAPKPKVDTPITTAKPDIILPKKPDSETFAKPDSFPDLSGGIGGGGGIAAGLDTLVKPADPPVPIMVEAKPDARFMRDFQPPYPAAMLRMQTEGNVTVRLTIGANGRVLDIALVSAADPAFFEATRKQALSHWRFTPATRDGVPVTSERVMTVRFRLTD